MTREEEKAFIQDMLKRSEEKNEAPQPQHLKDDVKKEEIEALVKQMQDKIQKSR